MPFDLSTLSLYPATPEQTLEARCRTHNEWGRGLTLEEHLTRDTAQERFECSIDGRFMTWVLAPRDNPTTLDFKCACETFQRIGTVYSPALGATEDVAGYGIASVFTPQDRRGQGFATHMMSLLHWVLADETLLPTSDFPIAKWGAPPIQVSGLRNARFSTLWSDVGDFYTRCGAVSSTGGGWVVRGQSTAVWDVKSSAISDNTDSDWVWLDDSGVAELWDEDTKTINHSLAARSSPSFSFHPSRGVAAFQARRLDMYNARLANPPDIWGVTSSDHTTYATWAIDPRPPAKRQLVTRLQAEAHTLPALLEKMFQIARKNGVQLIEVWGLSKDMEEVVRTLGARVFERDEHLPAFKWYGKESEDKVSWAFNERFCWC
ncbi:hypothetical protein MIND_00429300 [Mycena indigotica]|uniref:LYC1 C-terminal domain-containing protein n=1 Tax=Mycena indigotica TaxID=2126181 RepID=A0A8H6SVT6_9AGAR|nr:uncharacterized protein MIND_00429300 [Mycena indigotica]KAF7306381.1 hypothetical protein MIND_00429300 [Mycena indigotica]